MNDHGVEVYRVVYDGNDGPQDALVFEVPGAGKVFKKGEMFLLPGGAPAPANTQGEIPHVQDGPKGVSWSWAK